MVCRYGDGGGDGSGDGDQAGTGLSPAADAAPAGPEASAVQGTRAAATEGDDVGAGPAGRQNHAPQQPRKEIPLPSNTKPPREQSQKVKDRLAATKQRKDAAAQGSDATPARLGEASGPEGSTVLEDVPPPGTATPAPANGTFEGLQPRTVH